MLLIWRILDGSSLVRRVWWSSQGVFESGGAECPHCWCYDFLYSSAGPWQPLSAGPWEAGCVWAQPDRRSPLIESPLNNAALWPFSRYRASLLAGGSSSPTEFQPPPPSSPGFRGPWSWIASVALSLIDLQHFVRLKDWRGLIPLREFVLASLGSVGGLNDDASDHRPESASLISHTFSSVGFNLLEVIYMFTPFICEPFFERQQRGLDPSSEGPVERSRIACDGFLVCMDDASAAVFRLFHVSMIFRGINDS